MKLLTPASYQTKLRHSEDKQELYSVWSLSLSPADYAGTGKTNCTHSVPACVRACVGSPNVGLAAIWKSIMESRTQKTRYLQEDPQGFICQLKHEIGLAQTYAERIGQKLGCRLNAFSDLPWEHPRFGSIPQAFDGNAGPLVQLYDYSKVLSRIGKQPTNYALTASWDGAVNGPACIRLLETGHNVSVVFAEPGNYAGNGALRQRLPKRWRLPGSSHLWEVFAGDETDLRFLDPGKTRTGNGRICGLLLKSGSTAERDAAIESGFCQIVD